MLLLPAILLASAFSIMPFMRSLVLSFLRITPRRPVEELAEEMRSIEKQRLSLLSPTFHWEKAIVGSNDRIIPPGNQCRTWQMLNVPFYQTEDAHYSEPMFHQYLEEVWRNN